MAVKSKINVKKPVATPKKTSIGKSINTRFASKHDKRSKKLYRGQGK